MRIFAFFFRAITATAVVLGVASCGWTSDGGARLNELYHKDTGKTDVAADQGISDLADVLDDDVALDTPSSDEGGFDVSPGEVPELGLTGLWAVRVVQLGEISPISDPYPITTPDYFLVRIEPDAHAMDLIFCDEIPVVDSGDAGIEFTTRTTPSLRAALAASPLEVALGGGSMSLPAQKLMWTWGLKGIIQTDPMPTTSGDAKVFDQDDDGHPGVTVEVAGLMTGQRYMVKRAMWDLSAGVLSTDRIWLSGTLSYTLEEEPLGADPVMLAQKTPITPKDGSSYAFRRVGQMTCESLLAHLDDVFSTAP